MTIAPAHQWNGTKLETDVAIIGSGPAGLSLASRLKTDCVVVESGGHGLDIQNHHRFRSVISGEPCQLDSLRVRGIGGASLRWTGRCIPMDALDFEDRPWMSRTSWPLAYSAMEPWFGAAANLLKLPDAAALAPERARALQGLTGASPFFQPSYWRYADNPYGSMRFGDEFAGQFDSGNRMLLHNAHCTDIIAGEHKVEALRIVDSSGRPIMLKAKRFVVAAGCIESSRLLLLTHRNNPALLSEVASWLGKGFSQHLRVDAGEIVADVDGLRQLQLGIGIQRQTGINILETGLAITPEQARKERLGNASLILRYNREDSSKWADFWPRFAAKSLGETPILKRVSASVEIDSEQVVSQSSYIGLADELDPLGMPRANVHWTIDETDCRTAYRTMEAFAELLGRSGTGSLKRSGGIGESSIDHAFRRESNHQLGGTRMSANPADGVVDADLKVHGTSNLWVVGGSVFPTGGHANPTMTIVALALRLADHLNR